jgi:hypothetical protein
MLIFKHYVPHPMGKKTHLHMEEFFKKADLIGEGEMGIGGLFSFAVIVLIVFAYVFSDAYFSRYPIEQVSGGLNLACDTTLTNAQFSTGLMAIGIPPNDDIAPIFTLLDAQPFTLRVDFINAVFNCTDITVTQIKDIILPMTISSCNQTLSSASLVLVLPSQDISLEIELTGLNTIGGFRIGLEGPGVNMENNTLNAAYTLVDLAFAQALYVTGRLLTQLPSCTIQINKVINRTYPLEDNGQSKFSGIWLPVITGSLDQMFVDENEYMYGKSSNIILSIVISETTYYTLNTQRPITSHDEVIFTNLLFTIVCLEIFGLGFLICKLIIVPLIKRALGYYRC